MAAGVACVATTVGGIPEVIDDEVDGVLVEPGDPGALAGAIDRLLTDHDLRSRLGEAAARSPALPHLDDTVACLERLYRACAGAGDRRRPAPASAAPARR
jgi:glycosyltransferase involved in cell wall biosynthesis